MSLVRLARLPLFTAIIVCLPLGSPAAEPAPTLQALIDQADTVDLRQGTQGTDQGVGARMRYYANGDGLMLQGPDLQSPLMVLVCERAALFNVPNPAQGPSSVQARQQAGALVADQYMGVMLGAARLTELAGPQTPLPAPGASSQTDATSEWAYGQERYQVRLQRAADGTLRVRAVKTETITNAAAQSDADSPFSTDGDRAARLDELEPVGSWRELVLSTRPRERALDDAMSVAGWESMDKKPYATVGQVRAQIGDCAAADKR